MKPIVFLGGGRITAAMLAGLQLARYNTPLLVHDRHASKLRQLRKLYGVATESSLNRAVEQAGILLIAVRPASVAELLTEIPLFQQPVLAVSLAAGIPLAQLKRSLGPPVRWARAMPSPVCRSGNGLTALAFDRGFPVRERRRVHQLFSAFGTVLPIPETQFDPFTVTYSSSLGYHAVAALAAGAQKLGLNRKSALAAAAHAIADGVIAWREAETSLQSLLHEAATPGGTAAAVMAAMDADGYSDLITRSLRAGLARARANATSPGPSKT